MQQDPRDTEALRRRLYRPEASEVDVAAYARATDATDGPAAMRDVGADGAPAGPAASTAGRRRRVAVLGAGLALVIGAAAASGALTAPAAAPAASPTASAPARGVVLDARTGREVAAPAADSGARPDAAGEAEEDAVGRYRYTVAEDDTVAGVATRFGLCTGDVLVSLPYGFDAGALPAGQQLLVRRFSASPPSYDASGSC